MGPFSLLLSSSDAKPGLKDDCRIAKEKQNHGMAIVAGKNKGEILHGADMTRLGTSHRIT